MTDTAAARVPAPLPRRRPPPDGAPGGASDPVFPGDSEMAARCRAFDWAATPLGPVAGWSHSLRAAVGLVLASRHPMFLWWGPELVQLYNDAYRPSLGDAAGEGGRHPRALGARGRDFWTDIWDAIGPQITQVMTTGEATWHEDQYLPIERNGRREDVWWTYGYSPAYDDDGTIGGTLVVCQETTARVVAERERERLLADTARAEHRAARVLAQVSDALVQMDRDFRIVDVNPAAERALGTPRAQLVGRSHWEAFPGSVGAEPERQYRRVQAERVEAHFTHHYVDAARDFVAEVDAYPTDDGGVAVFWRDVTAQVAAEARLRASEALARSLVERLPGGAVFVVDRDLRYRLAGGEALRVLGLATGEFAGRTIGEVLDPAAATEHTARYRRALAGESFEVEHEVHGRAFVTRGVPLRDAGGAVSAALAVSYDVTERRQAEAALRASEARYRALFDSIDEGFCVIEVLFEGGDGGADGGPPPRPVDYRFLEANPAFLQQTGLTDAVGRTMRELAPAHEAHWFETYGRVALTGEPTRFEAPAEALGRWYDVYAVRVGDPEECRVAVLFRDVMPRRRAEAERERLLTELRAERERLRGLILQMPMPVALHEGPEHRYALVNDAYQRVSGTWRVVAGRTPPEAFPELAESGIFEILDRVYATGEPWVAAERPLPYDKDGTGRLQDAWFSIRFEPLRDAAGRVVGIINFSLDVTAPVRARHEVERLLAESEHARRDAEAANRAKGEFLAVMSHELRTPLNAIGGYAELIELGIHGPVTDAQRTALERIQRSQRHLLGLIAGVLDYSRVEAGAVTYRLADIPVAEAVAEAELLVAPQLRSKGLGYVWSGAAPNLRVRADREKLQQVLLNLLGNAVKFTEARDGVPGRIEVACTAEAGAAGAAGTAGEAEPGRVRIHVRDTGAGITAEALDRVFEPFVQVDQRLTRPHAGVGLGLAISRDLARGMGGDLTVESSPGVGSTFTLTLLAAI